MPQGIEVQAISLIESKIRVLESALDRFIVIIGKPGFIPSKEKRRFRFFNRDPMIFVTLKAVRVVTVLNSAVFLLKAGHVQEVGALIRMAMEFTNDMTLICESMMSGDFSGVPQEKLDAFFDADLQTSDEMMATPNKHSDVPRRKIYAFLGRFLKPDNPHRFRQISKSLEDAYGGYVHAF